MPSFWAAAFPKTLCFESSIKGSTWGAARQSATKINSPLKRCLVLTQLPCSIRNFIYRISHESSENRFVLGLAGHAPMAWLSRHRPSRNDA